jgi:hypothetical protein
MLLNSCIPDFLIKQNSNQSHFFPTQNSANSEILLTLAALTDSALSLFVLLPTSQKYRLAANRHPEYFHA